MSQDRREPLPPQTGGSAPVAPTLIPSPVRLPNDRPEAGTPVAETVLPPRPDLVVPGQQVAGTLLPEPSLAATGPAARSKPYRYTLLRVEAEGGLGKVWVARDADLRREVALKEIKGNRLGDGESSRRFLREAQVTGQLEHPNIVPVYELAWRPEDDQPFYTMRLLRGRTLRAAIAEHHESLGGRPVEALGRQKLLGAFISICQAISYAHSRGVVHRDLKPENVMVGSFGEVVVLDWGLAKLLGGGDVVAEELTHAGSPGVEVSPEASALTTVGVAGTPAYMAPEQARGDTDEVDERTDVYGLGAILFEILTGRPPAKGQTTAEVLRDVIEGPLPRPRAVSTATPRPLDAVCSKALAKDPAARYARASDLADDIERFVAGEPVSAWPEPWTVRARRWISKHRLIVISGAAAALVAALAGAAALATNRASGRDFVASLQRAEIRQAPTIVNEIGKYRFWANAPLLDAFQTLDDGSPEKLRVALGLLPVDPSVLPFLADRMVAAGADPATIAVVLGSIPAGDRQGVARRLAGFWEGLGDDRRFRASCVLAEFQPDDPRWAGPAGAWVVAHLMHLNRTDPVAIGNWSDLLAPVLPRLVPALLAVYGDKARDASERALAAHLLAVHAREPADLVAMAQLADDRDFGPFFERLRSDPSRFFAGLAEAAGKDVAGVAPEESARRRAQAGLALVRLGTPGPTWPLLRHSPDPSVRSWLIDRSAPLGVAPDAFIDRLESEPDPSARRALLIALGTYPLDTIGPRRPALAALLLQRYRTDPDAGTHGAIDWLLRRWGHLDDLRKVDGELKGPPRADRDWFVSPGGVTFSIVRGPVEFVMGSPEGEPGREDLETRHRRAIGRSFAISSREVTVAEFLEFHRAHPELVGDGDPYAKQYSPEPGCPVNAPNWFWATSFCRWLSEREGIAEAQMAYPPIPTTLKELSGKDHPPELRSIPPDYLNRTGYRLPTEAEWEFACRAGASTIRFFGDGEALLSRYAWHQPNSGGQTHPVGLLPPNDLGLFDTLGNLREWVHEPLVLYPVGPGPIPDQPHDQPMKPDDIHAVRGGSFLEAPTMTRGAGRTAAEAAHRQASCGFRLVRTMP
jgi:formylglycine-generating enzyme required for sulfatase activity/tRNA A-37 threonylcarbamoyl transferase component Bud32